MNITNKNATSFTVIKNDDGPTAFYVANNKNDILNDMQFKNIKPCKKSSREIIEYIIKKYNTEKIELTDSKIQCYKAIIIENYYPHLLKNKLPEITSDNITEKEIDDYIELTTKRHNEALLCPEEKLSVNLECYKIHLNTHNDDNEIMTITIEENTEHIDFSYSCNSSISNKENSFKKISNDIILFRGVSEKDIKEKTPTFMQYIYTLNESKNI